MRLPSSLKNDFAWWKASIVGTKREIKKFRFAKEIFSDASLSGWGACYSDKKALGQ